MTTPGADEVESPLARSADDESTLAFTVVVPTYGRPEGLRSCLESLAAQQYPRSRFEVIVIDYGSAIPAAPIAASFDDRLQIRVRRQANAGPAAARNRGGMSARGSYIAFLDEDCVAEPGWLRGFESAFLAHPRGTLLGGDLANPFTDNVYAEVGELILDVLLACYGPEPGGVYFFRTANLAVQADEFRAFGGFDPTFEMAEDASSAIAGSIAAASWSGFRRPRPRTSAHSTSADSSFGISAMAAVRIVSTVCGDIAGADVFVCSFCGSISSCCRPVLPRATGLAQSGVGPSVAGMQRRGVRRRVPQRAKR